jgi:Sel1 repeat
VGRGSGDEALYAAYQRGRDAEAESELGRGYLNGFDPDTTDYPKALGWLDLAARQAYAPAQLQLGYMYQRGWGTKQDRDTARLLYRAVEKSSDQQLRKTAQDLERSLDQEQQASNDDVLLRILGVVAVAALVSSSSPKPDRQAIRALRPTVQPIPILSIKISSRVLMPLPSENENGSAKKSENMKRKTNDGEISKSRNVETWMHAVALATIAK